MALCIKSGDQGVGSGFALAGKLISRSQYRQNIPDMVEFSTDPELFMFFSGTA